MNRAIFVFSILCGSVGLASSRGYELKMDLSLDGQHVSSPRVVTVAGETATVTQKNETGQSFIEVTANEGAIQGHKGILMKFVVGTISKNGKRTILSKPEVLAKENVPAQITVGKENGANPEVALSVVAQRKSL